MKAFLLAAGEGTRLRPLTLRTPKCLIPIGGKPLLEIWFKILEIYSVREVLINTHHLAPQVVDFISSLETSIISHITFEQELLGSAGTLLYNKDFIKDELHFCIIYADSLTTINLRDLLSFHKLKSTLLTVGLYHTSFPRQSGIVTLDKDNRIIDFIEKPENPTGDLANSGIMIASPDLIDHIPDKFPCDLSVDVLPNLVGNMFGKVSDEFFIDIGTPESYRMAQDKWDEIKSGFGFK